MCHLRNCHNYKTPHLKDYGPLTTKRVVNFKTPSFPMKTLYYLGDMVETLLKKAFKRTLPANKYQTINLPLDVPRT